MNMCRYWHSAFVVASYKVPFSHKTSLLVSMQWYLYGWMDIPGGLEFELHLTVLQSWEQLHGNTKKYTLDYQLFIHVVSYSGQMEKKIFILLSLSSGYKANITYNVEVTITMAVIGMYTSQKHALNIDIQSFHAGLQLNSFRVEGILQMMKSWRHMDTQLTREFCPEFVWEGSQPVSEHTSFDSLCLQVLMGLQTLGILHIGIPVRVRLVDIDNTKNLADALIFLRLILIAMVVKVREGEYIGDVHVHVWLCKRKLQPSGKNLVGENLQAGRSNERPMFAARHNCL